MFVVPEQHFLGSGQIIDTDFKDQSILPFGLRALVICDSTWPLSYFQVV
jgi:hypothetical protein